MRGNDGTLDRPKEPRREQRSAFREADSLRLELQAAADAATAHVRTIAATAAAEARLNAVSAIAIASAAILSLVLLTVGWLCLVALGVWLAIEAGCPVWIALLGALLVNVGAILLCWLWSTRRLVPNFGFVRTRSLLFPQQGTG